MSRLERNLRTALVTLIVVLFSAPLLLAFVLRFTGWTPGETVNHGELIEPPVDMAEEAGSRETLRDHWLVVALTRTPCDRPCEWLVDELLRVQRALGEDAHRVKILLPSDFEVRGSMRAAPLDVAPAALTVALRDREPSGAASGTVYLLDPRGYLVMRYPPGFEPGGMLDDLERLLGYSRVGVQ